MTKLSKLAIVFSTMNRPHVSQRLIRSIRAFYPNVSIYVGDQSSYISVSMRRFYESFDVKLTELPFDVGVSFARNMIVDQVEEEYFLLCDDDFIFRDRTNMRAAQAFLDDHPDFGVVGGHLVDLWKGESISRHWELVMILDRPNRRLVCLPIGAFAPQIVPHRGQKFYRCDAVMNFALIRKSIFSIGVKWDPIFKSNGEHEDFYLNIKENTEVKVAYFPGMSADHHHPENFAYKHLRSRVNGWKKFFEKWGIEEHLDLDYGLRTLKELDRVYSVPEVRSLFLTSSHRKVDNTGTWGFNNLNILGEGFIYANYCTDERQATIEPLLHGPDVPYVRAKLDSSNRLLVHREESSNSLTGLTEDTQGLVPCEVKRFDSRRHIVKVSHSEAISDFDDFIVYIQGEDYFTSNQDCKIVVEADFFIRWIAEKNVLLWETAPEKVKLVMGERVAVILPRIPISEKFDFIRYDLCVMSSSPPHAIRLASGFLSHRRSVKPMEILPHFEVSAVSRFPSDMSGAIARNFKRGTILNGKGQTTDYDRRSIVTNCGEFTYLTFDKKRQEDLLVSYRDNVWQLLGGSVVIGLVRADEVHEVCIPGRVLSVYPVSCLYPEEVAPMNHPKC